MLDGAEAEYLLESLSLQEKRIADLDARMAESAKGDETIERLRSVPGVGPKVAFAFVAYVLASRFENAGQVSNFLGLAPSVYMSGQSVRYGKITKRGNGYVRALLVQAAWALIRSKGGGCLKERFEYMTKEKGLGRKKSAVAVARRMAELLYKLMRDGGEYEARPFMAGHVAAKELVAMALGA